MAGGNNKSNKKQAKAPKKSPQEKTAQKKSKSSSSAYCCWVLGSILLTGLIGGLLAWDTQRNGGVFEKSATGDLLKRTGALPYVEVAYTKTLSSSARGFKWAEANVPVYANKTCVALQPYALLAKDLGIVGLNAAKNAWGVARDYTVAKTPVVTNFIEQYAPGLPQKFSEVSISTWNVISSTTVTVYNSGSEFFRTKVFIGSLSPENLQKALNQTQIAAANYYSWFHEKVDVYAKIQ